MSDEARRMLDAENAAKDRYELCKRILIALNSDSVDEAKTIVKEDMKIYEDEYLYVHSNSEGNVIELPNRR